MFKRVRGRKRPPASMMVACLALFVALSGGAYAAVAIPAESVGSAQLKAGAVGFSKLADNAVGTGKIADDAITFAKIRPGQIGHTRVDQKQIQWRVNGKCAAGQAIQSVNDVGGVVCGSTPPTDYSTVGLTEAVTSDSLADGPAFQTGGANTTGGGQGTGLALDMLGAARPPAYLVTSSPSVQVSGTNGAQNVVVTCGIGSYTSGGGPGLVDPNLLEARSVTFALGADHEQQAASIALSTVVSGQDDELWVACARTYNGSVAPTVQASAGLDALQTATVTATTPGTSTTAVTLTAPSPPDTAATTG